MSVSRALPPCKHKVENSEQSNEVLHLCRWSTHTQLALTQLTLTQLVHTQLAHTHTTCSHTTLVVCLGLAGAAAVCVAGVALTAIFTLRGRRGTYGTGVALVARLGLAGAVAVCVAGVALGDGDLHFAWQAWHLVTSTWPAWRLRRWAGSGGVLGQSQPSAVSATPAT